MFPKILVVEDDKSISDLISLHLKKNNFEYLVVHNGEDALSHLDNFMPDFVILDWMIPGLSGLEVLRRIRNKQEYKNLPILMLTAKNSEQDKIISFESGLDDYITKPFLPSELIARVKAILKRTNQLNQDHESLIFDDIKIDTSQKKAFRGARRLNLGPTEFKILLFLLKNKQKVFSREQILNKIWPNQVNVEIRTVDVHIRRLRKELNKNGEQDLIRTVRSAGYSIDSIK
ncbi:response regulator [Alphaproteobacteria bacterium]|nr:response regulator [Alphaproteobacteria bacterium]MDB0031877.1 response regulator [Alphaproteobacteria bacterium]MDB0034510.1 response regulator [Alphaproteobacteria bacterium]MDB2371738.1 response regulator [Alphaproteobacteria bacterium]